MRVNATSSAIFHTVCNFPEHAKMGKRNSSENVAHLHELLVLTFYALAAFAAGRADKSLAN